MYQLSMARIAGSPAMRSSLFSGAVMDPFQGGMSGRRLGASAQSYYDRAKVAIAKFDSLAQRTTKIANKAVREQIVADYGLNDAANKDLAAYMRNATQSDVNDAERFTPIAYEEGFPDHGPSRGRVDKLESFNASFESAVRSAEDYYGILPAPEIITNYITVPGQVSYGWVLPVVGVAALGVGIAWALGFFGKK